MSWNGGSDYGAHNAAERGRALREQQEERDNYVMRRRQMPKRERSQMGFQRTDTDAVEGAMEAWGGLNQRLDEALDEVDQAMKRERLASQTSGVSDEDLRRSRALRNRRGA